MERTCGKVATGGPSKVADCGTGQARLQLADPTRWWLVAPVGLSNDLSYEAGSFSCCATPPTGVFNQRFKALFLPAGALGCVVCFAPLPFLPVYLFANVGPQGLPATTLWGLLAAAWPAPFHNLPPHWVHQPPPCCASSLPGCPSPPLLPV